MEEVGLRTREAKLVWDWDCLPRAKRTRELKEWINKTNRNHIWYFVTIIRSFSLDHCWNRNFWALRSWENALGLGGKSFSWERKYLGILGIPATISLWSRCKICNENYLWHGCRERSRSLLYLWRFGSVLWSWSKLRVTL